MTVIDRVLPAWTPSTVNRLRSLITHNPSFILFITFSALILFLLLTHHLVPNIRQFLFHSIPHLFTLLNWIVFTLLQSFFFLLCFIIANICYSLLPFLFPPMSPLYQKFIFSLFIYSSLKNHIIFIFCLK